MSKKKKDVRDSFRTKVFSRDKNTCRTCGDKKGPMDAHHILNRNHMPEGGQGGYVPKMELRYVQPVTLKQKKNTGLGFIQLEALGMRATDHLPYIELSVHHLRRREPLL